jgi:hypothetical protein
MFIELSYIKVSELRVFENRLLGGIFVPQREKVIGGWRKSRNGGPHRLNTSVDIMWLININIRFVPSRNTSETV